MKRIRFLHRHHALGQLSGHFGAVSGVDVGKHCQRVARVWGLTGGSGCANGEVCGESEEGRAER